MKKEWSVVSGPWSVWSRRRPAGGATVALLALGLAGPGNAATVRLDAQAAATRAVQVSNAVAAAAARADAANQVIKAADAAALPSLSANAAVAQRSSVPEFAAPINGPFQPPVVLFPDITTTYGAGLRLQQALYAGGAISGLREATRHDGDAAAADRARTVADLRLAAQLAYWEAVRSSASVDVARAQEERARRLREDTQALLGAGMAVRADALAADERIASARVQVIVAETASANARTRLASLLHLAADDRIELADSLIGPLPPSPPPEAGLVDDALARRPELALTAAQLDALTAREKLARAAARPAVGAVAQWDYARPNQRYFPQADEWKSSWSVGLLASWSLFDGGRARADTSASQLTRRAASEDRNELERRIRVEVETARRDLESALAAVGAADAARAAGTEREREARERHAAGLALMVEILDAEAQLAAAEQQQINARASSWAAAAVLARAVGR